MIDKELVDKANQDQPNVKPLAPVRSSVEDVSGTEDSVMPAAVKIPVAESEVDQELANKVWLTQGVQQSQVPIWQTAAPEPEVDQELANKVWLIQGIRQSQATIPEVDTQLADNVYADRFTYNQEVNSAVNTDLPPIEFIQDPYTYTVNQMEQMADVFKTRVAEGANEESVASAYKSLQDFGLPKTEIHRPTGLTGRVLNSVRDVLSDPTGFFSPNYKAKLFHRIIYKSVLGVKDSKEIESFADMLVPDSIRPGFEGISRVAGSLISMYALGAAARGIIGPAISPLLIKSLSKLGAPGRIIANSPNAMSLIKHTLSSMVGATVINAAYPEISAWDSKLEKSFREAMDTGTALDVTREFGKSFGKATAIDLALTVTDGFLAQYIPTKPLKFFTNTFVNYWMMDQFLADETIPGVSKALYSVMTALGSVNMEDSTKMYNRLMLDAHKAIEAGEYTVPPKFFSLVKEKTIAITNEADRLKLQYYAKTANFGGVAAEYRNLLKEVKDLGIDPDTIDATYTNIVKAGGDPDEIQPLVHQLRDYIHSKGLEDVDFFEMHKAHKATKDLLRWSFQSEYTDDIMESFMDFSSGIDIKDAAKHAKFEKILLAHPEMEHVFHTLRYNGKAITNMVKYKQAQQLLAERQVATKQVADAAGKMHIEPNKPVLEVLGVEADPETKSKIITGALDTYHRMKVDDLIPPSLKGKINEKTLTKILRPVLKASKGRMSQSQLMHIADQLMKEDPKWAPFFSKLTARQVQYFVFNMMNEVEQSKMQHLMADTVTNQRLRQILDDAYLFATDPLLFEAKKNINTALWRGGLKAQKKAIKKLHRIEKLAKKNPQNYDKLLRKKENVKLFKAASHHEASKWRTTDSYWWLKEAGLDKEAEQMRTLEHQFNIESYVFKEDLHTNLKRLATDAGIPFEEFTEKFGLALGDPAKFLELPSNAQLYIQRGVRPYLDSLHYRTNQELVRRGKQPMGYHDNYFSRVRKNLFADLEDELSLTPTASIFTPEEIWFKKDFDLMPIKNRFALRRSIAELADVDAYNWDATVVLPMYVSRMLKDMHYNAVIDTFGKLQNKGQLGKNLSLYLEDFINAKLKGIPTHADQIMNLKPSVAKIHKALGDFYKGLGKVYGKVNSVFGTEFNAPEFKQTNNQVADLANEWVNMMMTSAIPGNPLLIFRNRCQPMIAMIHTSPKAYMSTYWLKLHDPGAYNHIVNKMGDELLGNKVIMSVQGAENVAPTNIFRHYGASDIENRKDAFVMFYLHFKGTDWQAEYMKQTGRKPNILALKKAHKYLGKVLPTLSEVEAIARAKEGTTQLVNWMYTTLQGSVASKSSWARPFLAFTKWPLDWTQTVKYGWRTNKVNTAAYLSLWLSGKAAAIALGYQAYANFFGGPPSGVGSERIFKQGYAAYQDTINGKPEQAKDDVFNLALSIGLMTKAGGLAYYKVMKNTIPWMLDGAEEIAYAKDRDFDNMKKWVFGSRI